MKNRFLFFFIQKTFQVRKQNHRESTRSLVYKYVTENTNYILILIFFPLLVAFFDSLTKTSTSRGPTLQKNLYLLESSSNSFNTWTLKYGSKTNKKSELLNTAKFDGGFQTHLKLSKKSFLSKQENELDRVTYDPLFQLSQKKSIIQPFLKFRQLDEFPNLLESSKQSLELLKLCENKTFYHITTDLGSQRRIKLDSDSYDQSKLTQQFESCADKQNSNRESEPLIEKNLSELNYNKRSQVHQKKLDSSKEAYLFDKDSEFFQYDTIELLNLVESICLVPQNEENFIRKMSNFSFPDTKINSTRNQRFWSNSHLGFPKRLSDPTMKNRNSDSWNVDFDTKQKKENKIQKNQKETQFFGAKPYPDLVNDERNFEFDDNLLENSKTQSRFSLESFDDLVINLAKYRQKNEVDSEWEENLSRLTGVHSAFKTNRTFFGESNQRVNKTKQKMKLISSKNLPKKFERFDLSYSLCANQRQESSKIGRVFESGSSLEKEKNTIYSSYYKSPNYLEQKALIESFATICESLSISSWLVLTQFSFGFIVLHFINSFYQQYGKEVILSCIDFLAELGFSLDELKQELGLSDESPALRVFQKINIGFDQVAGFDAFLPQIYEIVWFLKNKGRPLGSKMQFSNSLLLVGAPGTGKTYLVQAIAGEAKVPVLVQSCSALLQENGPEKLQDAFQQARTQCPCILFLDELDTIGVARQNILEINETSSNIFGQIYSNFGRENQNQFGCSNLESKQLLKKSFLYPKSTTFDLIVQEKDSTQKQNQQTVLTQLLRELDGLTKNHKIFVIGATNRVETLDLALTRPGRFNQVINIGLPTFQKRIELFKLYTKKLGYNKNIVWNRLAEKTSGLSAAYISSIVNESSIHTIYEFLEFSPFNCGSNDFEKQKLDEFSNKKLNHGPSLNKMNSLGTLEHTMKSLERALDIITKSTTTGSKLSDFGKSSCRELKSISPSNHRLLAYYQSGHTILKIISLESQKRFTPFKVSLYEPTEKTARYNSLTQILSEFTLSYPTRLTLENLILEQFGGKAGEILANYTLSSSKQFNKQRVFCHETTLGVECLAVASFVAQLLLFKIYGYPTNGIQENFIQIDVPPEGKTLSINKSNTNFQNLSKIKTLIVNTLKTMQLHDWFRICLSDPNETEQNVEWLPLSKTVHFNEWSESTLIEGSSSQNTTEKEISSKHRRGFSGSSSFSSKKITLASRSFQTNSPQLVTDFDEPKSIEQTYFFLKKYAIHKSESISFSTTWNDLKNEKPEVFLQALLIQSYDIAINILDQNRAWLDFLSFYLVKEATLTSIQVKNSANRFYFNIEES